MALDTENQASHFSLDVLFFAQSFNGPSLLKIYQLLSVIFTFKLVNIMNVIPFFLHDF